MISMQTLLALLFSEFCESYNLKNVIREKTYLQNTPDNYKQAEKFSGFYGY